MKKWIVLLIVAIMAFSLVACGENKESQTNEDGSLSVEVDNLESAALTKDELLSNSQALTREEIDKSLENIAFAKSLVGNVYTFEFTGLTTTELRTAVAVTVYGADDRPISKTLIYSPDTYGNGKTELLGDVCRALFAYSDSATAFFAG